MEILENIKLSNYTTIHLGGNARKIYFPKNEADLLDISKLRDLGWESTITLHEGIRRSYNWYLENEMRVRDKINT